MISLLCDESEPPATDESVAIRPRVANKTWRVSDAAIVGLVLLVLTVTGTLIQFPLRQSASLIFLTDFQRLQLAALIVSLTSMVVAGALVIRIARNRKLGEPLASIGWNLTRYVAPSFLVGVVFAGVLVSLHFFGNGERFRPHTLSVALYILSSILAAPLIEECYFRGVLFVALQEKIGRAGSILINVATIRSGASGTSVNNFTGGFPS